jgi:hypothetical protein
MAGSPDRSNATRLSSSSAVRVARSKQAVPLLVQGGDLISGLRVRVPSHQGPSAQFRLFGGFSSACREGLMDVRAHTSHHSNAGVELTSPSMGNQTSRAALPLSLAGGGFERFEVLSRADLKGRVQVLPQSPRCARSRT